MAKLESCKFLYSSNYNELTLDQMDCIALIPYCRKCWQRKDLMKLATLFEHLVKKVWRIDISAKYGEILYC